MVKTGSTVTQCDSHNFRERIEMLMKSLLNTHRMLNCCVDFYMYNFDLLHFDFSVDRYSECEKSQINLQKHCHCQLSVLTVLSELVQLRDH